MKEMEQNNDGLSNENHSIVKIEQHLNSNKIQLLNPSIEEANRCIEEAKCAIQLKTKQLEKCKQELKEQSILLQEFESKNIFNSTLNVLTNEVSLKPNKFQASEKEHDIENKINLNAKQHLLLNNSITAQNSFNNLSSLSLNNVQPTNSYARTQQKQSQILAVQTSQKNNEFGSITIKKDLSNDPSYLLGSFDFNSLPNLKSGRGRKRKKVWFFIFILNIFFLSSH